MASELQLVKVGANPSLPGFEPTTPHGLEFLIARISRDPYNQFMQMGIGIGMSKRLNLL